MEYKCLCVYRTLWLPWQPRAGSLPRPQSSKTAAAGQPRSVACLKLSWLLAKLILRDRLQVLRVQDTLTGCYPLFLSLSSGLQSHLPNYLKHPHISTGPLEKAISFLCIGTLLKDLGVSSHSLHQIDSKPGPSSACSFKCGPMEAPMGAADIIPISQMEKQLTRAAPDTCSRP